MGVVWYDVALLGVAECDVLVWCDLVCGLVG